MCQDFSFGGEPVTIRIPIRCSALYVKRVGALAYCVLQALLRIERGYRSDMSMF